MPTAGLVLGDEVHRRFLRARAAAFAISASVLPMYFLSSGLRSTTISMFSAPPAARIRFSQSVCSARISARHALADRGIAQAREPGRVPARLHPGRHRGIEARRARRVGVHVGRDAQALAPRRLDVRERVVHLRPVRLAAGLQVIDLRRRARAARDVDRLVHGLDEAMAFAAHVRRCRCRRSAPRSTRAPPARRSRRSCRARRSARSRRRARPPPSPAARRPASPPAVPASGPRPPRRAR